MTARPVPGPRPRSLDKVFLEPSATHLFLYCQGCLWATAAEGSSHLGDLRPASPTLNTWWLFIVNTLNGKHWFVTGFHNLGVEHRSPLPESTRSSGPAALCY